MEDAMSDRPLLRIVRGNPSDAELAALTVVVATMSAPAAEPEPPRSLWADHAHRLRTPLRPGLGAWRASGLPR
jgi:hypothetical protein